VSILLVTALLRPVSGIGADFDDSGSIDFDDFFMFADVFGQEVTDANRTFDLNGDGGEIDFDDFFAFADGFGRDVYSRTTPSTKT